MAEQNSGWSNLLGQSGIVNYPLLGLLPNIMSRGYQYQAVPTHYQRDAKADWGRAINEGLNQYFSQLPQYYQQVRSNQLQKQKLAQEQQLFDLKMQEAERIKSTREAWPETVASLPIKGEAKKYLTKLGYDRGAPLLNTFMSEYYKAALKGKGQYINKALATKLGNPALEGSTLKADGTIDYAPEHIAEGLTSTQGGSPFQAFATARGLNHKSDTSPENKKAWEQISGPSDFMQFLGTKPSEFQQRAFIKFNFPEWHPVWKANNRFEESKNIKISNDGTVVRVNQASPSAEKQTSEEGVRNEYNVPLGDGLEATIIPPVVSPWTQEKDVNQRLIKNRRATESAKEFKFLAGLGKDEMSLLPIGRIKGLTEALSWRIIADIQKEREFGVLSPSEITTIKKSVPNPNDWVNYLLYEYGDNEKGRQYVQASMDAYLEELEGTKRGIHAEMSGMRTRGMNVNEWDYEAVDWTKKYDPNLFKKSKGYRSPVTDNNQQSGSPLGTIQDRNAWALDLLKSLAD